MATYIKTLKEDNGDITYPQTKASAVLLTNNSDLETELTKYVTAEDIASTSALTPPVQTNMIADGAVTSAKINYTTFDQFGTAYTGTNCTAYVASFGKVAFICGTTSAYTWSGTYEAKTFTLPAGIVPSGTIALYVKLGTFGHTVDDAQYTHDYGGFTFSSSATTIGFPLLSGQAASKSCSVAFFIPCILP